jgi:6,7-dimethyl-8-ribityllumazine synthase
LAVGLKGKPLIFDQALDSQRRNPTMAQTTYSVENLPEIAHAKVAILRSKWYLDISEAMTKPCIEVLLSAGCQEPDVHTLPGCLELPLAVRRVMKRDPSIEAVIVFGVILKGDTYHFDLVKDLCMSGLEKVSFECNVPIINQILPVDAIEHAYKRAANDRSNKGLEAAIAAIEVIDWRRAHPA